MTARLLSWSIAASYFEPARLFCHDGRPILNALAEAELVKRRSILTGIIQPSRNFALVSVALTAVFLLSGSSCRNNSNNANVADSDPSAQAPVTRGVVPQPDAQVAVIETENPAYGKIVIELYPNIAPKMVARFKELISQGFYNGVTFHRINPDLGIIQGGDPLSKDAIPGNDGTGDSTLPNVPGEFSDIPYEAGTVGAARKGGGPGMTEKQSWDTANCQFFITLKKQPAFDQRYTVFGKVVSGLNNANIIANAPVAQGSERPEEKIAIKSVTLEPRSNYVK
jgi:cyclophilin family peptidyl-prolyl cis-trans isomerase